MTRIDYTRHERIIREAAALLRVRCPASLPVVVRFYTRKRDDEDAGRCDRGRKQFTLWIARDPCPVCMLDTLFEEWGHARSWGAVQSHKGDHDSHFAIEYWRCRREYYSIL